METENLEVGNDPLLLERLNRVRPLNISDKLILEELMGPRLLDLEKKGTNVVPYTERLLTFLDNHQYPNKYLFGYFDESGALNSIMGLYFWNTMPFATLSYMFVKKNLDLFNANKNGLNLCLHKCFEISEARDVTTFFSLQNAKSFKHKTRTWRKNDTFLTKKYFSIPKADIQAGTTSEFKGIQDLMDYQTWPYDTTLWMTSLKPEYQKKINWGKD